MSEWLREDQINHDLKNKHVKYGKLKKKDETFQRMVKNKLMEGKGEKILK